MFPFITPAHDVHSSSVSDSVQGVTPCSDSDSLSEVTVTSLSDSEASDGPPARLPNTSGVGGVGLSAEYIARRQPPLMRLIDRLRSLGVQYELDLPQIVAVGPQNVGKSSLIEAISGIKLPRASGTCTRCPIELRMGHCAGIWRCNVSLHFIYDENDSLLGAAQTYPFGEQIFNPADVEDRVRRAQRAVLSPSVNPRDFLQGNVSGPTDLTFSKNYISIQIQGPNSADLSFVDLPGMISSARQGKEADIPLIEDLVRSYIEKPSTLILLVVACEADFVTQASYQFVKKYDRHGSRTIGVLTKPDRIAEGDEEPWVRFIKDEEEQLELGWFCVKQPDAIQLKTGLTWEEAHVAETEWFQATKPWNLLPAKYSKSLGRMNLVERLGETLSSLIARRLPDLREKVEELLQQVDEDFKYLPVPPSEDALAEMMHLINAFCADVSRHSEGVPAPDGLIQEINAKQAYFRRSILSLAPEFRPFKYSESVADMYQAPPCEILDGEEEDCMVSGPGLVMYIDEVMDLLKHSRTRELPDYYPYEVPKIIIARTSTNWGALIMSYFEDVLGLVSEHYKHLVEEHFKNFEIGGLLNIMHMEIRTQIQKYHEETKERLKWLLLLEARPFTLNTRYLNEFKSKFLAYYKMYRYNVINNSPVTYIQTFNSGRSANYVSEVLSSLSKMNIKDVKASDLAKLLPEDDFAPALDLMAEVSAYFQVSCKRIIDLVPLVVDVDFVRALCDNLQTALYTTIIKDDARGRCKNLLQESPAMASRRANLQRKHERLQAARAELLDMHWMNP